MKQRDKLVNTLKIARNTLLLLIFLGVIPPMFKAAFAGDYAEATFILLCLSIGSEIFFKRKDD